jgi:hypothetical protein
MRKEAGDKGLGERNTSGKAYSVHTPHTAHTAHTTTLAMKLPHSSDLSQTRTTVVARHASVHNSSFFLLMILDGIGLAMITGSTILEGFIYWKNYYHLFWEAQTLCVFLWISGRTFQVVGLGWLLGKTLCAVCCVLCALCSVLCALCSVLCALCSVLCALCSVLCALCAVRCALDCYQLRCAMAVVFFVILSRAVVSCAALHLAVL